MRAQPPQEAREGAEPSLKVYFVRPGRYRFMVRSVVGGLADPTPAKRLFRVVRKH
jgi:hypothetical protein